MKRCFGHLAAVMACALLIAGSALGRERETLAEGEMPSVILALQKAWFLGGAVAAGSAVQPLTSLKTGWQLVPQLSDEFNGMELDAAKWDNDVPDWGVWSWEPENAWVANGLLNIRMQYEEHRRGQWTLYYKSGIVKSKAPPIRYGYFEARIKAARRYPGVGPAFWAYRDDGTEWTEIDFVELTQRNQDVSLIDTNVHVFRLPGFSGVLPLQEARTWKAPWDPRDGFHVYGCEWDENEIRWYVDGHLVQTRKNDYWHQALDLALSMGVRGELKFDPNEDGFPTTFQVDYVRVWSSAD